MKKRTLGWRVRWTRLEDGTKAYAVTCGESFVWQLAPHTMTLKLARRLFGLIRKHHKRHGHVWDISALRLVRVVKGGAR